MDPSSPQPCGDPAPTAVMMAPSHDSDDIFDFGDEIPPSSLHKAVLAQKDVQLLYGDQVLHGTFYLVDEDDYLQLHSRFFAIPQPDSDMLQNSPCRPWALFNRTHGLTWADIGQLPGDSFMLQANGFMAGHSKPNFAAISANPTVVEETNERVGSCNIQGKLEANDEIIIALPCDIPFSELLTLPQVKVNKNTSYSPAPMTHLPPLPVDPSLLQMVDRINAMARDSETNTKGSRPRRLKVRDEYRDAFAMNGYLNPDHAIYQHRGNEFLMRRDCWQILCQPFRLAEEEAVRRGHQAIPIAYHQVLFADLQQSGGGEDVEEGGASL